MNEWMNETKEINEKNGERLVDRHYLHHLSIVCTYVCHDAWSGGRYTGSSGRM